MTFNCEDNETDRLLVAADNIEMIVKVQLRPLPEALGADKSPTSEAARGGPLPGPPS